LSSPNDGRQAALHPDLLETESYPRGTRPALWDVAIECEQVDSSAASGVESSLGGPRAASGPDSRRLGRDAGEATDRSLCSLLPFFHDGTERPIQRPKDPEEQQESYSGKKKCHTLKNLLVINETCHICFLSHTYEGKASDKCIAELAGYTLPPGSGLYQDKGFQGFFLPGITIFQPKKAPRGGELTPPEKATNRRMSSTRIRIEHAIGGVKRSRLVKDKIRLLKDGLRDSIMETCCGLHNFRLQYRPWHYAS
jgi:hypothetical protein